MSQQPERTVAQKMGVKAGSRAHLVDAPPGPVAALALPELDLVDELTGEFDYLHLFVSRQEELRDRFGTLRDHLRRGGMLWVSWPKGGRLGTDLTMKSVIAIGYSGNLVESTCLRVDDTWSALKFTHPKPGKTYHNSYGTLPAATPDGDVSVLRLPVRTERLSLRLHEPADASWLMDVYGRPDVARYLLDEPWTPELTRERLDQRLARTALDGESGALALVVEHDGAPVGDVALWLTDKQHGVAEIGWVLHPDAGGRGLATEAVRRVLDIAFDTYGLHRVAAQMDARNTASARLATKVGMRQEAHLRQDWWSKGEWTDTVIFAMLAPDRE